MLALSRPQTQTHHGCLWQGHPKIIINGAAIDTYDEIAAQCPLISELRGRKDARSAVLWDIYYRTYCKCKICSPAGPSRALLRRAWRPMRRVLRRP